MLRSLALTLIVLAGLAHAWLGLRFIRASSMTFDEGVHLASGYAYWTTGRLELNVLDHPPLAEMWAALPLLPLRPLNFASSPDFTPERKYHYADAFIYKNRVGSRRLLGLARGFNLLTWGGLLLACLAWWAWRLEGPAAAACAALLFAFTPGLYANEALATTDAASTALAFAAFCLASSAFETGKLRRLAGAGLCAGLAAAAKFNMVLVLLPLAALVLWEARRRPRPGLAAAGALAGLAALGGLALVYRGDLALFVRGLLATFGRLDQGRASFFLGRHSDTGFFWYFPYVFFAKTPLALLALGAAGLTPALAGLRRRPEGLWLLVFPALYFGAALAVKVQIGQRHLLPLYPFWILLAATAGSRLLRTRAGAAALVLSLGWEAASALSVQPHPLAYFNELAGGPENGYHKLVDSNLDWGQDLPALADLLKARGNPPLYLCYFGTADPAAEGIRYHPVVMGGGLYADRPGGASPAASDRVWLAVSATNLQSTYYRRKDVFDWLLRRRPDAEAGWSIFLYDLSSDAEGREELARVLDYEGQRGEAAALRAWKGGRA